MAAPDEICRWFSWLVLGYFAWYIKLSYSPRALAFSSHIDYGEENWSKPILCQTHWGQGSRIESLRHPDITAYHSWCVSFKSTTLLFTINFNEMLLCSRKVVSDSFATPWTVVHQAPLSMGFSRQEYWGGLPFPSPADLPHPGIEPTSPAMAGRFFTTESPREAHIEVFTQFKYEVKQTLTNAYLL